MPVPSRRLRRGGQLEPAFEQRAFQEKVAAIFRALDRPYIERIDASPPPEQVHAEVLARVARRLGIPLDPDAPELA